MTARQARIQRIDTMHCRTLRTTRTDRVVVTKTKQQTNASGYWRYGGGTVELVTVMGVLSLAEI